MYLSTNKFYTKHNYNSVYQHVIRKKTFNIFCNKLNKAVLPKMTNLANNTNNIMLQTKHQFFNKAFSTNIKKQKIDKNKFKVNESNSNDTATVDQDKPKIENSNDIISTRFKKYVKHEKEFTSKNIEAIMMHYNVIEY